MDKLLKISLTVLLIAGITLIIILSINYSIQRDESESNVQKYQISSERAEIINTMLEAFDNPNIQRGYIVFSFTEETTKDRAEIILNKYGLEIEEREICFEVLDPGQPPRQGGCMTASDWNDSIKVARIKVPVGKEKEYAKKILENEAQVGKAEPDYQVSLG